MDVISFSKANAQRNESGIGYSAKQLPFARELASFETPNNPIITPGTGTDWDAGTGGLHQPKIYYNSAWGASPYRCYYSASNSSGVFSIGYASAATPMGTWTKNMTPILTATESFEDATYGIGNFSMTYKEYASVRRGWYSYREGGVYKAATCIVAADGNSVSNKTPCTFDSTITSIVAFNVLSCVFFDNQKNCYIGLMHGTEANGMISVIAKSTDGIAWTYLGKIGNVFSRNVDTAGVESADGSCITKAGSYYIVFGHRWVNAGGDRKHGWFAISTDCVSWYVYPEPISIPYYVTTADSEYSCLRYPSFTFAVDSWLGAHAVISSSGVQSIKLIEIKGSEPYTITCMNNASVDTGTKPSTRPIFSSGAQTLELNADMTFGTGKTGVTVNIYAGYFDGDTSGILYEQLPTHVMTMPNISGSSVTRETLITHDVPNIFKVEVKNDSGYTITDVEVYVSLSNY